MPHRTAVKQFSSQGTTLPSMSGATSHLSGGIWSMALAVDPSRYLADWNLRIFINPSNYPINVVDGVYCIDDSLVRDVRGLGWAWSAAAARCLPAGWSKTVDGYIQAAPLDAAPVLGGATVQPSGGSLIVQFPANLVGNLDTFKFSAWAFAPDQVMHEIAAFWAPYQ